jgi:transcriptional regulator with XRE-family HTH domain
MSPTRSGTSSSNTSCGIDLDDGGHLAVRAGISPHDLSFSSNGSHLVRTQRVDGRSGVNLSLGAALKRARELRGLSAIDAARAAAISGAYLSKLEADAVKKPSPHVLHSLSQVLAVPYAELMRLCGYQVPGESERSASEAVTSALFADLTDDEKEELLEYLAWYRARRRSKAAAAARR